jgi:hypothetical protein
MDRAAQGGEEMWWIWLLILIAPLLWFAVRGWKGARGRSDERDPLDPKRRKAVEDEVRRRQDGSGPTVAGGQHLG